MSVVVNYPPSNEVVVTGDGTDVTVSSPGPQGATGPTGATGATGATGPKGDTGDSRGLTLYLNSLYV